MKIHVMNGWADAPHCWKQYLTRPVRLDHTPSWVSVSVFGVSFFFVK